MSEYERWQGRFAAAHYVFGEAPNAFLKESVHTIPPGSRVLSIADGEGRNGVWLAEQGHEVTAQDFSPVAQGKAQALADQRGVSLEFELSDITERTWAVEHYDAVAGIFFQFLEPEARAKVFEGIRRTLKPGGVLLIEGYRPKQLDYATGGPKARDNLYTAELLEGAFGDFAEWKITSYDAELDEGPGHSGRSALVDFVGRK